MHLLKVQDAASAPEVAEMTLPGNLAPVNTWKYSVISPYAKPNGNVKSWVNYLNKVSIFYLISDYSRIIIMIYNDIYTIIFKNNFFYRLMKCP